LTRGRPALAYKFRSNELTQVEKADINSYEILFVQYFVHDHIIRSNNILCVSFFKDFIRFRLKDASRNLTRITWYETYKNSYYDTDLIIYDQTNSIIKETYNAWKNESYTIIQDRMRQFVRKHASVDFALFTLELKDPATSCWAFAVSAGGIVKGKVTR
jgi:hypothetical protein